MKIVQQTPTVLKLQDQPVGLWIFGSLFVIAGLFVMTVFGRASTLTCRRVEPTQGKCELAESGLLGSQSQEIPLTGLQGAKVETSSSSDGDTYRVALLTRDGNIPLTSIYSSGYEAKQASASRVDAFVSNPGEALLTVRDDSRWFAYPFGGIFVAAGLFVVSVTQVVTCSFDKTLGCMVVKRKGLFKTELLEHRLREVLDVQVEDSTDSDGDQTYRVRFLLACGDRLPLTSYYSSGRESKQEAVNCICKFLKG